MQNGNPAHRGPWRWSEARRPGRNHPASPVFWARPQDPASREGIEAHSASPADASFWHFLYAPDQRPPELLRQVMTSDPADRHPPLPAPQATLADWLDMLQGGLDAAALLTSPVPVFCDLTGGAADALATARDPSLLNFGLMGAGLIPFFPGGTIKRVGEEMGEDLVDAAKAAIPRGATTPEALEAFRRGQAASADAKATDPVLEEAPATLVGPLFDYGEAAMRRPPSGPQLNASPYSPVRGVPGRTLVVTQPRNLKRVTEAILNGAERGGFDWYNTDQLLDYFTHYLGPEQGAQDFRLFMDMVAATSPASRLLENIRNGSFYYMLARQGRLPLAAGVRPPKPYGHFAQPVHLLIVQSVLERGWDAIRHPKTARLAQNLVRNELPFPLDRHNMRSLGLVDTRGRPVDSPTIAQYQFLERLFQSIAKAEGLTSAQAHASLRIGDAARTGLLDTPTSFLEAFERVVGRTAEARSLSKQEVLKRLILGQNALIGLAAAAILGRMLGDEDAGRGPRNDGGQTNPDRPGNRG